MRLGRPTLWTSGTEAERSPRRLGAGSRTPAQRAGLDDGQAPLTSQAQALADGSRTLRLVVTEREGGADPGRRRMPFGCAPEPRWPPRGGVPVTAANTGLRVTSNEGEARNKMVGDRFSHVPDFVLALGRVLLKFDVLEQGLANDLVHSGPVMVGCHGPDFYPRRPPADRERSGRTAFQPSGWMTRILLEVVVRG